MNFDDGLGPINYVVVTFPAGSVPPNGFALLAGLVDAGRILLLDAEFVEKQTDGTLAQRDPRDVGLPEFAGSSASLIDADDLLAASPSIQVGEVAAIIVYEDLTLLGVIDAWRSDGGSVVAEGPVSVDELVDALDSTEGAQR